MVKKTEKIPLKPIGKKGTWKAGENDKWDSNISFSLKGEFSDLKIELTFKGAEDKIDELISLLNASTPMNHIAMVLHPSEAKTLDEHLE